jgi:thioredoxin-dependent peroxiredoxin
MKKLARRTVMAFLALATATGAYACASRTVIRPDGGEGMLASGDVAPDFIAKDPQGAVVKLSALRGQPVVVFFYPKDETPGCTKEACAFRDSFKKYDQAGVKIVGVSRDSDESHKQFQDKYHLPFPLAADEDGSITRSYGVLTTLGMASRVTFLLGKDGRIARVYPKVDPGVHADELLQNARELK